MLHRNAPGNSRNFYGDFNEITSDAISHRCHSNTQTYELTGIVGGQLLRTLDEFLSNVGRIGYD